jgi:DtxR family Mn-dependent transcriptional regulator
MVYHKNFMDIVMPDHITKSISQSEQMYLITIARALEDGGPDPLPLSQIAQRLSLQPVSVNQMVRKLEAEGLVHYHPYKGVELTSRGQAIAYRTLRNRRLWQLFLVDQLQVSFEKADAMACDLEHITPDDIAQRLSSYLDEPAVGPGGHPIPALNGDQTRPSGIPLSKMDVGMPASVAAVNARSEIARFLYSEGVRPGAEFCLVAIGSRGNRLLKIGQDYVDINLDIVESIQVYQTKSTSAI